MEISHAFRRFLRRGLILVACLIWADEMASAAEPLQTASRLNRTNLLFYPGPSGEILPVQTKSHWEKRRAAILRAMQEVMGPLPGQEKRCPLDPANEEEVDCGTFVRRRIQYSPEPGSRLTAYLLVPKTALQGIKSPGILALHQTHVLGQKVVVGLGNSPDDEYGVELVKRGFVVLAPPYPLLADYHPDLTSLGYRSGTMKAIWDNMRGMDYLLTLPFVQTNGFGAIGHSLGGHNSIYTAAFDKRIRVVVSSCGFDSFRDYKNGDIKGWTSARYMPRLLTYSAAEIPFDFHELIGCLAPRSCFVSAPLGDTNFQWRSVDGIARAALPVYELFAVKARLQIQHPDCGHLFPQPMREEAYRVLENTLKW
jgi:dienelactone hydrolase